MSGSKIGGQRAAATNKAKHGEDYYSKIGKIGGRLGGTGGFASSKIGKDGLTGKERASRAGKIGGEISRRKAK